MEGPPGSQSLCLPIFSSSRCGEVHPLNLWQVTPPWSYVTQSDSSRSLPISQFLCIRFWIPYSVWWTSKPRLGTRLYLYLFWRPRPTSIVKFCMSRRNARPRNGRAAACKITSLCPSEAFSNSAQFIYIRTHYGSAPLIAPPTIF
jgi:hypothetical protein